MRGDLQAQRETLLPLIAQMETNAKALERESQSFAQSVAQSLKSDQKKKQPSDLTIEKETSTKNPEVVRWHIRGQVGKIHVRGVTHDFHRGIDRADRFDAIKTLIRTDGKSLPIAARLKVFHAINRTIEKEATT